MILKENLIKYINNIKDKIFLLSEDVGFEFQKVSSEICLIHINDSISVFFTNDDFIKKITLNMPDGKICSILIP